MFVRVAVRASSTVCASLRRDAADRRLLRGLGKTARRAFVHRAPRVSCRFWTGACLVSLCVSTRCAFSAADNDEPDTRDTSLSLHLMASSALYRASTPGRVRSRLVLLASVAWAVVCTATPLDSEPLTRPSSTDTKLSQPEDSASLEPREGDAVDYELPSASNHWKVPESWARDEQWAPEPDAPFQKQPLDTATPSTPPTETRRALTHAAGSGWGGWPITGGGSFGKGGTTPVTGGPLTNNVRGNPITPPVPIPIIEGPCPSCDLVQLDWTGVSITSNRLEQNGEIRYSRVGMYNNRRLDLVITLAPNANPDCSGDNDACQAMPANFYGGIAVKRGAGREIHGIMTLKYTDTNLPAVRTRPCAERSADCCPPRPPQPRSLRFSRPPHSIPTPCVCVHRSCQCSVCHLSTLAAATAPSNT